MKMAGKSKRWPVCLAALDEKERAQYVGAALTSMKTGQSLRAFCIQNNVPYASMWELLNPEGGDNSAYARAREIGTHYMADECIDIIDEVERIEPPFYEGVDPKLLELGFSKTGPILTVDDKRKLAMARIDTRLRLIGKWNPKDYGDKRQVEHSGKLSVDQALDALDDDDDSD
jgi:hypothetical protein